MNTRQQGSRTSETTPVRHWWPLLLVLACGRTEQPQTVTLSARELPSPAPAGSRLPQLNLLSDGRPLMSWLEPRADSGFTFRFARWEGSSWSRPQTIADSRDVIMFDADLHAVSVLKNGSLLANWQIHAPNSKNPWATVMQLAISSDAGRSWSKPAVPHDNTPGSHGFVATFPLGDSLGVVWLDERPAPPSSEHAEMGGVIGLRYAAIGPNGTPAPAMSVDSVTCECCPNSAAVTSRGPIVAFRNRVDSLPKTAISPPLAVRDIHVTRLEQGHWTPPVRVHADNFLFKGCPDNGPAIAANADTVAIAWWTAPDAQPVVRLAFSTDGGQTFGAPFDIDDQGPEGQVTVALAPGGAIVGWLANGNANARWVGFNRTAGPPLALGPAATHTRLPHWLPFQDGYLATWTTETNGQRAVRSAVLQLASGPRHAASAPRQKALADFRAMHAGTSPPVRR